MTTLGAWPINYMEQALYVAELIRRKEIVEKTLKPVHIVSFTKPTRQEWETAFTRQTGKSLPILPGTRLCWNNPFAGRVTAYSTAYDLNNGLESSGDIYNYVAPDQYNRGAFRLLAVASAASPARPATDYWVYDQKMGHVSGYTAGSFLLCPLDLVRESKRGLLQIWIIGLSGGAGAIAGIEGDQETARLWTGSAINFAGVQTTANSSASTPGVSGGIVLGVGSGVNPIYSPVFCRLDAPAIRLLSDNMQHSDMMVSFQNMASGVADDVRISMGARIMTIPSLNGIVIQGLSGSSYKAFQKLCAYGIYADNDGGVGNYAS